MFRRTVFAALLGTGLPVFAQPAAAPLSVTATASYVSAYMYRGRQLAGASFQPAVEAGAGQTVFGVWSSAPLSSGTSQHFTEVDPYASYSFALGSRLSLAPGIQVYTYPDSSPSVGSFHARYEPNLSLNCNFQGVRLTPAVYYDLTLRELTVELTASAALPLAAIGSELDFAGTAGNYTAADSLNGSAPDQKAWGSYWLLGATLPYQIVRGLKLSLGYAYTAGVGAHTQLGSLPSRSDPQAVGRSVVTVSLALTF